MDRAEIQHRIEELKEKRQKFIDSANAQVTYYNGMVAALEELIAPKEPAPESPKEQTSDNQP